MKIVNTKKVRQHFDAHKREYLIGAAVGAVVTIVIQRRENRLLSNIILDVLENPENYKDLV